MSIPPEGEAVRKAVRYISEKRVNDPEASLRRLMEEACLKFNLSPADAAFLTAFYTSGKG